MMTDYQKALKAQLNSFSNLNEGHGPIVPKWLADEVRSQGIHDGYLESKPLQVLGEISYNERYYGKK